MMNSHCQFDHQTPDGLWQCAQCDYIYKIPADKPPIRNCPVTSDPDALADLATRAALTAAGDPMAGMQVPDLTPAAQRLADETGDPTIVDKISHYAVAFTHWAMSGFKTRSKKEVRRIYEEHCRPCEEFDSEADACTICGCNARVSGMAARNKIAMATEVCPIGKWGDNPGPPGTIIDEKRNLSSE